MTPEEIIRSVVRWRLPANVPGDVLSALSAAGYVIVPVELVRSQMPEVDLTALYREKKAASQGGGK
jgi:hypothetical protein